MDLHLLRLKIFRAITVPMVAINWWGRRARNLSIKEHPVPVENGSICVRVYTPEGQGPFPVMLYLHGGGFVGCSLNTHDGLCRDLCVSSSHVIVSADYRLAPEHPFPVPVMDSLAALDWVHANGELLNADLSRFTIGGDSAGGNLAAVLALQARERHPGWVKGQVLIYPCVDDGRGEWPSYETWGGKGYALTKDAVRWLYWLYTRGSTLLKKSERHHDLLTPLHVKNLAGLPPALVSLAECDVLHDEGKAYAKRLTNSGCDVSEKVYPGQQHGFVGLKPSPAHKQAVQDITSWLALKGI